ncbi:MAG: phosphotransferase [Anaerolineae bacterium]|nr:MAG: phosphotransferase [Anaerolineae bacterium]
MTSNLLSAWERCRERVLALKHRLGYGEALWVLGVQLLDDGRLLARSGVLDRENACFVHGDYHCSNVNVEEGWGGFHVTGVFDFAHAQGWSPEWDMARLMGSLGEGYPALVRGFFDGYADTAGLPENLWPRLRLYRLVMQVGDLVRAYLAADEALLEGHQARLYRFLEEARGAAGGDRPFFE